MIKLRESDAVCVENVVVNPIGATDDDDPTPILISTTPDTFDYFEIGSNSILPSHMVGDITDARALELQITDLANCSEHATGARNLMR
uniref:AlNc14C222G9138 protein n=1 Tax=Albugo laibachii Nc14 TaxID=890382 RepID=F0WRZ6_9STRA|nr:AlNc14C222G9138 [Albugo laibachii Nc14]|eukprot:CCA24113.1 AlNc14C222G9138 [Albugo laibachii Nc14]